MYSATLSFMVCEFLNSGVFHWVLNSSCPNFLHYFLEFCTVIMYGLLIPTICITYSKNKYVHTCYVLYYMYIHFIHFTFLNIEIYMYINHLLTTMLVTLACMQERKGGGLVTALPHCEKTQKQMRCLIIVRMWWHCTTASLTIYGWNPVYYTLTVLDVMMLYHHTSRFQMWDKTHTHTLFVLDMMALYCQFMLWM